MLVQSRKHPEWWIFPAGGVDRGERPLDAALRETREEAGLLGRPGLLVCETSDDKSFTSIWALHVETELEQWLEDKERQRRWFDLGVGTGPAAERATAEIRRQLSPKPQHQQILDACTRLREPLRREAEACESLWGRPRTRTNGATAGAGAKKIA